MNWNSQWRHLVLAATVAFLVPGLISLAVDWKSLPLTAVASALTFPAIFSFVLLRTHKSYWPDWTSTVTSHVLAVSSLLVSGVPAFIAPEPAVRTMAQFIFTQQSLSTASAYIYLFCAFREIKYKVAK